jgi:SAM-dependent methyltransferase
MPYDPAMLEIIRRHSEGLVLDCGAGSKAESAYFPNVVCYEIVDYPSTDVLGVAEHLPFKDAAFDAVLSVAVLEHVRDPIQSAKEIVRVLKPGGDLLCAVPFLQPMHGFPHHYFNATPEGLRRLFDHGMIDVQVEVPDTLHPVHSLHWILTRWTANLSEQTRDAFTKMTVADLLAPVWDLVPKPFAAELSQETRRELACGSVLTARKALAAEMVGFMEHRIAWDSQLFR